HAVAVGIAPTTGCTIDRNADGLEKNAVSGAGRHRGDQGNAGKILGDQLFGRAYDFGVERWGYRDRTYRWNHSHFHTGIANRSHECGPRALHRLAGEYSAIDVRGGPLRQR